MAPMTIPALVSLVTLGVTDLARSVAFYDALGWHRSSASVDGVVAFYKTAGPVIGLFPHHDLADDANVPLSSPSGFRGVTLAINLADDHAVVNALLEAQKAGAIVVKPAEMAIFGGLSGYFADPDGHLWEMAHNPGFPQHPDGTLDLPD